MEHEKDYVDCSHCGVSDGLEIDRWFISREAMDKLGMYSWEERCSE